jgi:hypothetical protein
MKMMNVARVFPTRTSMTPTDELAFTSIQPPFTLEDVDEVHVSVAFTWDMKLAEQMAEAWKVLGVPVKVGGRAYKDRGGDFVPGMYLKHGAVITSRGCDNHCWFCDAWRIEGPVRELPITEGWNVLDNNLLGCTEAHIKSVFAMLARQPQKPVFTGGLEARLMKSWHAESLRAIKTQRLYCAYDTKDDYEPLVAAGRLLRDAGFTFESHVMACYVLIGYPGDTFELAEQRLTDTIKAGFMPYAMLYRSQKGNTNYEWRKFQREWLRPQIVARKAHDCRIEEMRQQGAKTCGR